MFVNKPSVKPSPLNKLMTTERMKPRNITWLLAVLCAVVITPQVQAADEDTNIATIRPDSPRSDFFGEQETALSYQCSAEEAISGKVLWRYAAGSRTLARGEDPIQLAAGRTRVYELPIEFPPVRDGVVLETRMVVTLVDQENETLAEYEQPIWLFPEDPYTNRREWLEQLDIHLYDPEGNTVKLLEANKIPHTRITNSNVLVDFDGDILIVGSGTSLSSNRGLTDNMVKMAQRGVHVVCLAPVDGEFPWPMREKFPELSSVQFASQQVIRDLDKRLNPQFDQLADDPQSQNTVALESRRGQLRVNLSEATDAWPWWQVRFENSGTCILCCFDLIQHWDDSPTPRFLFARLLENLSSQSSPSAMEQ